MMKSLRSLMAGTLAFISLAMWGVPAQPPRMSKATFDELTGHVTITATAPTETEFDENYIQYPLDHITKVTIERHAPITAWPDEPLAVLTDIKPGDEICYVDQTAARDQKYEYRLTCWVDSEKGSSTWASAYTGTRPGELQAFEVSTPDHLSARFDVKIVAPEVSEQGNPLTGKLNLRIENQILYDWYLVADIKDVDPGEVIEFPVEEGVQMNLNYTLRAYAYLGENGTGVAQEAIIYVGEDIPLHPSVLNWEATDNAVTLSWDLPEKGVRGGSIDPDNVQYNISVRYSGDKDFTTIKKNHIGEEYTFDLNLVEEEIFQFAVTSVNSTGESYKQTETPEIVAGPPARYPFTESFTGNMFTHRGWTFESTQDDPYYTYKAINTHNYQTEYCPVTDLDVHVDPQDKDGGLVAVTFYGHSVYGQTESLVSPHIDFTSAENPTFSLWYFHVPVTIPDSESNIVLYATNNAGEFEQVYTTEGQPRPTEAGWYQIIAPMPMLAGQPRGQVKVSVVHGSWSIDQSLDNFVVDEFEVAGITAPEAAAATDAPVEYFNLQGIRVENPAGGVFIRRQGDKATKVLIK